MAKRSNYILAWEPDDRVSVVRVYRKGVLGQKQVDLPWSEVPGASRLNVLLEQGHLDSNNAPICSLDGSEDRLLVSNDWIASLNELEARHLMLPPATPLTLRLQTKGTMANPEFCVEHTYTDMASRQVRAKRVGAFLKVDAKLQRLPKPLYQIARQAELLEVPIAEDAEKYRRVSDLTTILPDAVGGKVNSDLFLDNLQLKYAASLSLNLIPDGTSFDFDPVLFGRNWKEEGIDDSLPDEEADSLLSPDDHLNFVNKWKGGHPSQAACTLRPDTFVYFDPELRPVLTEIKKRKSGTENERRDFALNPRRYIRDILGDRDDIDDCIESIFIETEQYSSRVLGADVWKKQVLPWITPKPNSWMPEKFGLKIGDDKFVEVPIHEAPSLVQSLKEAESAGMPTVKYGAEEVPVTPQSIMAAEQLEELSAVFAAETAEAGDHEESAEHGANTIPERVALGEQLAATIVEKYFLLVSENFEQLEFEAGDLQSTDLLPDIVVPAAVQTQLKQHQVAGLAWLANCQHVRASGALLADDMGLGKTLQALAALCWRKAKVDAGEMAGGPVLIVAPTALIQNWQNEIATHLSPDTFTKVSVVAGAQIKRFRTRDNASFTDKGDLDFRLLSESELILTTYETMRDYHMSFARVPCSVIIFDEIQKAKNPASQVTRAAKSLNGLFKLGLTGTPVENRLQDLWSIVDILWPGYLGSSKAFSEKYPENDLEGLKGLRYLLEKGKGQTGLPLMVRRMKVDQLEGLPEKNIHTIPMEMPKVQADAYAEIVLNGRQNPEARGGQMLQVLHHLRGVSLSPRSPEEYDYSKDPDEYISESARLIATFDILDQISTKGEKAIVFLETIAMQSWLAGVISRKYALMKRPGIINGSVAGVKRQSIVDDFQNSLPGFDVLILSPKAAGVGLTITAANHVIHLSRWWNPAVEDQATDRVYRIGQDKPVHVYLPQAVHPNEHLRHSSFDLKIQALIDRKRALAGELIVASEAGEDELSALFTDVLSDGKIDQDPPAKEDVVIEQKFSAPRPTLSLPKSSARQIGDVTDEASVTALIELERKDTISIIVGAGPRPVDEMLQFLGYGKIREIWIEDPYLFAERDFKAVLAFLKSGVLDNVDEDFRLRIRALHPDCDRISRSSTHPAQALFATMFKCVQDQIPGTLRFERDLDLRPSPALHNRQVIFVLQDSIDEKDIVYGWSLPKGLVQWMDERDAIGPVLATKVPFPFWISKS